MELGEYQKLSEEERMRLRLNNLVAAVHGHDLLTEDAFKELRDNPQVGTDAEQASSNSDQGAALTQHQWKASGG